MMFRYAIWPQTWCMWLVILEHINALVYSFHFMNTADIKLIYFQRGHNLWSLVGWHFSTVPGISHINWVKFPLKQNCHMLWSTCEMLYDFLTHRVRLFLPTFILLTLSEVCRHGFLRLHPWLQLALWELAGDEKTTARAGNLSHRETNL